MRYTTSHHSLWGLVSLQLSGHSLLSFYRVLYYAFTKGWLYRCLELFFCIALTYSEFCLTDSSLLSIFELNSISSSQESQWSLFRFSTSLYSLWKMPPIWKLELSWGILSLVPFSQGSQAYAVHSPMCENCCFIYFVQISGCLCWESKHGSCYYNITRV